MVSSEKSQKYSNEEQFLFYSGKKPLTFSILPIFFLRKIPQLRPRPMWQGGFCFPAVVCTLGAMHYWLRNDVSKPLTPKKQGYLYSPPNKPVASTTLFPGAANIPHHPSSPLLQARWLRLLHNMQFFRESQLKEILLGEPSPPSASCCPYFFISRCPSQILISNQSPSTLSGPRPQAGWYVAGWDPLLWRHLESFVVHGLEVCLMCSGRVLLLVSVPLCAVGQSGSVVLLRQLSQDFQVLLGKKEENKHGVLPSVTCNRPLAESRFSG